MACTLIIANSTFANNRADVLGGALHVEGNPDSPTMDMRVLNSTFANNSVASGVSGAAIDYLNPTSSALTLANTIVGANGSANCRGPISNGGNNLDADGTCGVGPATDPLLDPAGLKDNGGSTATIALRASSPAIDTAQPTICSGPIVNKIDQRGEGRPKDGDGVGLAVCDIGASQAPWVTDKWPPSSATICLFTRTPSCCFRLHGTSGCGMNADSDADRTRIRNKSLCAAKKISHKDTKSTKF